MLTIRDEQMQQIKKNREINYSITHLCEHLRQHYNYTTIGPLSDSELRERVQQVVGIARSYGLQSERDIYNFVTLELTHNPNFHRHQKVQDLLQASEGHPKMRMYWLAQQLHASDWVEVS